MEKYFLAAANKYLMAQLKLSYLAMLSNIVKAWGMWQMLFQAGNISRNAFQVWLRLFKCIFYRINNVHLKKKFMQYVKNTYQSKNGTLDFRSVEFKLIINGILTSQKRVHTETSAQAMRHDWRNPNSGWSWELTNNNFRRTELRPATVWSKPFSLATNAGNLQTLAW